MTGSAGPIHEAARKPSWTQVFFGLFEAKYLDGIKSAKSIKIHESKKAHINHFLTTVSYYKKSVHNPDDPCMVYLPT